MERKTSLKLSTRLMVLLFLMGAGLIVASVLMRLFVKMGLLAMLTVQDVIAFIAPAIVAMAIFYRQPLRVMCLDRFPNWKVVLLIVLFYVVSLPGMNWLVSVNQAMTLPSWMSGIEQIMRKLEESATETTELLLDITSVWQLICSVFVIGIMAGVSEEVFFRGAMLRTMQDSRLGTHAVVWIVAIIFSAFHMQFYGFIPRMVLALWLGYLFVWTRSLWAPIIAHALNNSTVVVMSYLAGKGIVGDDFGDQFGLPADGAFPWLAVTSVVLSIALAIFASRQLRKSKQGSTVPLGD